MIEYFKKTTLWISLLLVFMFSISIFAPVYASDLSMSINATSASEEDDETIFDIMTPYEMAEQQGGLPDPVPTEITLSSDTDDSGFPEVAPITETSPLRIGEGDQQFELSEEMGEPVPLDPPPMIDHGLDLSIQDSPEEDEDRMPARPEGNWMTSALVLVILLVLMIAAFLVYIAKTEGKFPIIKQSEKKTKKKKQKK